MKNQTERQLRLECLRIAANVVCQLKDPKLGVVDTASAFFKFVDEGPAEADANGNAMPYRGKVTNPMGGRL